MSGVDFLKSCKTNVRIVEDLLSTQYSVYQSKNGDAGKGQLLHAVKDLRQQNVLCSVSENELWVFGKDGLQSTELFPGTGYDVQLKESGNVRDSSERRTVGRRAVKDILLDAIERLISHTLAQQQCMLHVGPWQWLCRPLSSTKEVGGEDTEESSVLLRMEVDIAENGTLYLYYTSDACSMRSFNYTDGNERMVVLAPNGHIAKSVVARPDVNSGLEQCEKPIVGSQVWKQKVIDRLMAEGITAHEDEDWIPLQLLNEGRNHRVLWPARLCLICSPSGRLDEKPDWKYWFSSSSMDNTSQSYQNPLGLAEDLFNNASTLIDETNADSAVATNDMPTSTSVVNDSPLATSPPFNQRTADVQAAMAGIYPTPPDGFMPTHPTTQVSTSDALQTMQSNESAQFLGSDDAPSDPHRHSVASSTEPYGLQNSGMGVDDLFEDMGMGEMDELGLGANEVGDADFDYFDEPDESGVETSLLSVQQDVDMSAAGQPMGEDVEFDLADPEANSLSHPENSIINEHFEVFESTLDAVAEDSIETTRVDKSSALQDDKVSLVQPQKPLSPFSIRERLLPPPIPASAKQPRITAARRNSTFDALAFNEGLDLNTKHWKRSRVGSVHSAAGQTRPDINIPPTRKRRRQVTEVEPDQDSGIDGLMDTSGSSGEGSPLSPGGLEEAEVAHESLPPQLPWELKKRKRVDSNIASPGSSPELVDECLHEAESEAIIQRLEHILLNPRADASGDASAGLNAIGESGKEGVRTLTGIEKFFDLTKLDLVYIAQIISEQANTVTTRLARELRSLNSSPDDQSNTTASVRDLLASAIHHVLPTTEEGALTKLALIKEPPQRPTPTSTKTPQTPQPRPQMREGSMQLGLDYFAIPPPYVRIQRGGEPWEMLPPALSFWSALGLGPASGPKNVSMVCLLPNNVDLAETWIDFQLELGRAYEGYKLGSLYMLDRSEGADEEEWAEAANLIREGVVSIKPDGEDLPATLRGYAASCTTLGTALASVGHLAPERTIAVCVINPFEQDMSVQQHLCACFWLLYEAYRDNVPKAHRHSPRSDLVLQILPISMIASDDGLVFLNAQQFGALAIELYDRCPPSAKAGLDISSPLPILAAPAVQLASLPPKRIGFQHTADPPCDLLHEGSILHLAYACSNDGAWITVCWIDSTAQYQRSSSLCLRGRSFKDVANEVWEQTMEILSAREVMWRVFVVSPYDDEDDSFQMCWKKVVTSKPRKQELHVTLLSFDTNPSLQFIMPAPADVGRSLNTASTPGASFLTPGSTPQGAAFTVSPDANGQNNAPLTPAPSDATTNMLESDPDAYLIDSTDESWAMLLAHQLTASEHTGSKGASGLLFRRGSDNDPHGHLEALSTTLHWDVRLRPNGLIDEGPPKQIEANLRDVLRMFRSLCLLTKIRGLEGDKTQHPEGSLVPIHVVCAIRGAAALSGLLEGVE